MSAGSKNLCLFFFSFDVFQLVSIDRLNFSVEAMVTAKATSLKVRTSPSFSVFFHASTCFVLDHIFAYFSFLSVCFRASFFLFFPQTLSISVLCLALSMFLCLHIFRDLPNTPSTCFRASIFSFFST